MLITTMTFSIAVPATAMLAATAFRHISITTRAIIAAGISVVILLGHHGTEIAEALISQLAT